MNDQIVLWYTVQAVPPRRVWVAWAPTPLEIGGRLFKSDRSFYTLAVDIRRMMEICLANPRFVIFMDECSRMREDC